MKGDKGREKKSTDAVDDKIDYAALFKKRNKKSQVHFMSKFIG